MTTKDKERTRPAEARTSQATKKRRSPVQKASGAESATTPRRRRQERPARTEATPDVVYLPPKTFQRNRLLFQLLIVVAVVLAFLLGVSVFFKVDASKTTVAFTDEKGNVLTEHKYSVNTILEASGIQDGDYLLTFNRAQVAGKIIAALPYVDSVRIGIKLPDTVNIEVVEVKVPYAVKSSDDQWWFISAGGKVMEPAPAGVEAGSTKILGVRLDAPKSGEQAVALEDAPVNTDEEGNPIPPTTTQAQRLSLALRLVSLMEQNEILGQASSVDVNQLNAIQIQYGQQYQVKLGSDSQLDYKISCMKAAIEEMSDYQSGVLDISFTNWPDQVVFTPS